MSFRKCSKVSSSSFNSSWKYSAKAVLVLSSFVGPKPPVVITISPISKAECSAFLMVSISSETVKICTTGIPILLRRVAIKFELVSTVFPDKISSPIVMRTAFIIDFERIKLMISTRIINNNPKLRVMKTKKRT